MRVLDRALDKYPEIVSVVVSGYGGVTEAVAAMKRGAHDFLIKPFELPQLSRVLKTGLGQRPVPGDTGRQPTHSRRATALQRHPSVRASP